MRLILTFFIIFLSHSSFAQNTLPDDCEEYESVNNSNFVLLHKSEFIKLGECAGASLVKQQKIWGLTDACREISEYDQSLTGIFSLSKVEAIKIGVCLGTINAIYSRYNNERVSRYSSRGVYHCERGEEAVYTLMRVGNEAINRSQLRDALCRS